MIKIKKLETDMESLNNELGSLTVQLNSSESQRQQLAIRNSDLTSSVTELKHERDHLTERVRDLESDVQLLNAQVEELTNVMTNCSPDIDQLRERCIELAREAGAARHLEAEKRELREQLDQSLRHVTTISEDNQQLR